MIVKLEIDPKTGEYVLPLPEEIIKTFDIHPGDDVLIKELEDGCLELTFPK